MLHRSTARRSLKSISHSLCLSYTICSFARLAPASAIDSTLGHLCRCPHLCSPASHTIYIPLLLPRPLVSSPPPYCCCHLCYCPSPCPCPFAATPAPTMLPPLRCGMQKAECRILCLLRCRGGAGPAVQDWWCMRGRRGGVGVVQATCTVCTPASITPGDRCRGCRHTSVPHTPATCTHLASIITLLCTLGAATFPPA